MKWLVMVAVASSLWLGWESYQYSQVKRDGRTAALARKWGEKDGRGAAYWQLLLRGASDDEIVDFAEEYDHELPLWLK